jgi:hypothetical protein
MNRVERHGNFLVLVGPTDRLVQHDLAVPRNQNDCARDTALFDVGLEPIDDGGKPRRIDTGAQLRDDGRVLSEQGLLEGESETSCDNQAVHEATHVNVLPFFLTADLQSVRSSPSAETMRLLGKARKPRVAK